MSRIDSELFGLWGGGGPPKQVEQTERVQVRERVR